MNFEKDDRGLIGAYEDEYRSKIKGESFQKEKEKALEGEVSKLFKKICFCLDSMTRMNFVPRNTKSSDKKEEFVVDETVPIGINSYYSNNKMFHNEIHKAKR
jgi:U3 small nucleolar ribonucleoprotein component